MTQPEIVVVNIFSVSFSGSTWLNLLLGAHPDAASIGEAKRMLRTPPPVCSLHLESCPVFSRVSPASGENIFLQLARVLGKRFLIVNNSRKLLACQDHPAIQRRFIHLLRDGRATAASYMRKRHERSMWRAARWWVHDVRRNQRLLNRHADEATQVRYEDLHADTAAQLQSLCAHVGMSYQPSMLEYWGVDHHFIGGNVGTLLSLMQKRRQDVPEGWQERIGGGRADWHLDHYRHTDPARFRDDRWQTELTAWQRRLFGWVAGPTNRRYGYPVR